MAYVKHYVDQAVRDLGQLAAKHRACGRVKNAKFVDWCCFYLHMAMKFSLPDYGLLFDRCGLTKTEVELFRLPYRAIAAEYFCPEQRQSESIYKTLPVAKRIALAVEFENFRDSGVTPLSQSGVVVVPIGFINGMWIPGPSIMGLLYDNPVHLSRSEIRQDAIATRAIDEADLRVSETGWGLRFWIAYPGEAGAQSLETMKLVGMSPEAAAVVDCGSEKDVIVQLAAALACSNVQKDRVRPDHALQAKRMRLGKPPLYDYHVLMIAPGKESEESTGGEGTHASPRQHLRRGHIRRLHESARAVWVNAHLVGRGPGRVEKDYAVAAVH